MTDTPYIRAKEAAQIMQIALKTLYNQRYQNKGPKGYKVGKFILYKPEEIKAYIESHSFVPTNLTA